jgi:predicted DCC family thiol-disulfide oxidoreductase YuxK
MVGLTVLYDPDCGLCRRAHEWLLDQPKLVQMNLVPIKSAEARKRFPVLNHELTSRDLTVISEQGAVYFGPKAWLMVLWALCRYREWSYRLASPELLPTTKRVVSLISQNRYQISRLGRLSR